MNISSKSERLLHWWASITIVVMGLTVIVPRGLVDTAVVPLWLRVFGGMLGAVVATFYFRMLFECIFRSHVAHRALWIVFFLAMPVFSAIVYFMTTRSITYHSLGRPPAS